MDMLLHTPPEPLELKEWMLFLQKGQSSDQAADQDSYVLWAGNKLPKYLWDHWKSDLKPLGLTWQKFMKLLRYRSDVGVLWYKGTLSWEEFIRKVSELIKGPIGRSLKKKKDGDDGTANGIAGAQDLGRWQYPPVSDWNAFERLCRDLWAYIWKNPDVQRNGRGGQTQAGVDVFGRIAKTTEWGGVQCKKKDAFASDSLDEAELRTIVDAAKSFNPPLSKFIVAYTGRRDTKLQEVARSITEENKKVGLFEVTLWSWDDIHDVLGNYSDLIDKYLPTGGTVSVRALEKAADERDRKLDVISDQIKDLRIDVVTANKGGQGGILQEAVRVATDLSLASEYNSELDHAKDLLDKLKPKEALDLLLDLEERAIHSTNRIVRFRLLTNKAAAKAALGEEREAGELFIEAHQFNPDDEKAICNRALGHLLLGQHKEANELVNAVIQRNPASRRAYELMVYCTRDPASLDQIIQRIPHSIRKTDGVAYAISQVARRGGNFEIAIHWLEVAIASSGETRKHPDLTASLGSTLLESLMAKYEVINAIQMGPDNRTKIERSIELLTDAINAVATSETIKFRTYWLLNRSTAYKLLNRLDEALADIERALALTPGDPVYLKQRGFTLYLKGQTEAAINIFTELVNNGALPEAALILGGILHEQKRNSEAIKTLEESLVKDLPTEIRIEEQRLLIQIYTQTKDFEAARGVSRSMRSAAPTDVLNLVEAARIERLSNNPTSAAQLLDEARRYVINTTPTRHIIELADELFSMQRYSDAWPLYERIVDVRLDTPLAKRLLHSYYWAGEVEKVLEACNAIPDNTKSQFAAQVHLSVLEDIGNLTEAASVYERYLTMHPGDLPFRIRFAITLFRLDSLEKLDEFLGSDIEVAPLPPDAGFQLAWLYGQRNMPMKCLRLAYELRRTYFNDGEAHLKYVGLFFSHEKLLTDELSCKVVGVDTAVCVKDETGALSWHVLEDREGTDAVRHEVNTSSPLGKKLLGAQVGDDVVVHQGGISNTTVKVQEIKSKYVYALHESLEIYPQRFADTPGLERVTVRTEGSPEAVRQSYEVVFDAISKRSEFIGRVEKLYSGHKIAIGTFASLIGTNVIDIWEGLLRSKWGVRACLGTAEEREEALTLLGNNRVVAVDITALLTAKELESLAVLRRVFDQIFITQSTLDLIQELLSDRKSFGSTGFMTVGKEDGAFYRTDISEEVVKANIRFLEELKEWIKNNCIVTPCKNVARLGEQRRENLNDVVGKAFLETMLIAEENSCPLYSDDYGTRGFAKNEFKVQGVWTQAVLIHAAGRDAMTLDEYAKATVRLAQLNYQHTTINAPILLEAAKEAEWVNRQPFAAVIGRLAGPKMEISSAIAVAVDFMFLLWRQPITDLHRDGLLMAVLDALTRQGKKEEVLRFLDRGLRIRFRLIPLAEARIRQVISAWQSLRT